jgi:hypothetical protein
MIKNKKREGETVKEKGSKTKQRVNFVLKRRKE